MKKYQMAWCYSMEVPTTYHVMLGSTEADIIKWFHNEIKKLAPRAVITEYTKRHDLDGNIIRCEFEKLNDLDSKIRFWLIQNLLQTGWEPFSVTESGGTSSDPKYIYFRREVIE